MHRSNDYSGSVRLKFRICTIRFTYIHFPCATLYTRCVYIDGNLSRLTSCTRATALMAAWWTAQSDAMTRFKGLLTLQTFKAKDLIIKRVLDSRIDMYNVTDRRRVRKDAVHRVN